MFECLFVCLLTCSLPFVASNHTQPHPLTPNRCQPQGSLRSFTRGLVTTPSRRRWRKLHSLDFSLRALGIPALFHTPLSPFSSCSRALSSLHCRCYHLAVVSSVPSPHSTVDAIYHLALVHSPHSTVAAIILLSFILLTPLSLLSFGSRQHVPFSTLLSPTFSLTHLVGKLNYQTEQP